MARDSLSIDEARRIALAAQGFDQGRPKARVDIRHLRAVISRLGLLQIDYVNVLVPAHYQVPFSRLGPYERSSLDTLVYKKGEFTEQWAHEASIVPMSSWPLLRHRMKKFKTRPNGFEVFMTKNPQYVKSILSHIFEKGPISAEDVPKQEDIPHRLPGTWARTVPRAVLETFFGRGELAVARRRKNFTRMYDLAERIVPKKHHARTVDDTAAQRELLLLAARAHGVGTAEDLGDYYRMSMRDVRPRIAELVDSGALKKTNVDGWVAPAYLHPRAKLPKRIKSASLLSPFDPVVWFRPRVARLFDFDYRIEIFFPQAKRKWGYYVLPFLLNDKLVARVDLKADRAASCLMVPAAYIEPAASTDTVGPALATELATLAGWLGLDGIKIGRRGNFTKQLGAEIRRC